MGDVTCEMRVRSELYPAIPDRVCRKPAAYDIESDAGKQPICADCARSIEGFIQRNRVLRPDGETYFKRGEVVLSARAPETEAR